MVTILQIIFVLGLIVLIILFVFETRRIREFPPLPENFRETLGDYVLFYQQLNEQGKKQFEERVEHFLSSVQVTGVKAVVEDLDRILIAAGGIIPVFSFPDWQYVNLHEVLLYPGNFNEDFDQAGADRNVTGMVGTGGMQNMMIISKWQLRQGFINHSDTRNTAIHEFAHLIDKMDGTMDGVPEIILERKHVQRWKSLVNATIQQMKTHGSDIDIYGATNPIEFFAVITEYFFQRPDLLKENHPDIFEMLEMTYRTAN
ncbi:MAG TPA: M90 family metallopeptidase [Chitinophagaceae bacterium]|nr:M90 family metallopeptidase [Chitinophagaceae bacterium]